MILTSNGASKYVTTPEKKIQGNLIKKITVPTPLLSDHAHSGYKTASVTNKISGLCGTQSKSIWYHLIPTCILFWKEVTTKNMYIDTWYRIFCLERGSKNTIWDHLHLMFFMPLEGVSRDTLLTPLLQDISESPIIIPTIGSSHKPSLAQFKKRRKEQCDRHLFTLNCRAWYKPLNATQGPMIQIKELYPPETNSEFAPENGWQRKMSFCFGKAYFQVRTVSFREGTWILSSDCWNANQSLRFEHQIISATAHAIRCWHPTDRL